MRLPSTSVPLRLVLSTIVPLAVGELHRRVLARDRRVQHRDVDARIAADSAAVGDRVSAAPRIDERGRRVLYAREDLLARDARRGDRDAVRRAQDSDRAGRRAEQARNHHHNVARRAGAAQALAPHDQNVPPVITPSDPAAPAHGIDGGRTAKPSWSRLSAARTVGSGMSSLRHQDAEREAAPQTGGHRRRHDVAVRRCVLAVFGWRDQTRQHAAGERADARSRPSRSSRGEGTSRGCGAITAPATVPPSIPTCERAVLPVAELAVAAPGDRAERGGRGAEQRHVRDERRLARRSASRADRTMKPPAAPIALPRNNRFMTDSLRCPAGRLDEQRAVREAEQQAERRRVRGAGIDVVLVGQQVAGRAATGDASEDHERGMPLFWMSWRARCRSRRTCRRPRSRRSLRRRASGCARARAPARAAAARRPAAAGTEMDMDRVAAADTLRRIRLGRRLLLRIGLLRRLLLGLRRLLLWCRLRTRERGTKHHHARHEDAHSTHRSSILVSRRPCAISREGGVSRRIAFLQGYT